MEPSCLFVPPKAGCGFHSMINFNSNKFNLIILKITNKSWLLNLLSFGWLPDRILWMSLLILIMDCMPLNGGTTGRGSC